MRPPHHAFGERAGSASWALSAGEFDGGANETAAADGGREEDVGGEEAGSSVAASNQAAVVAEAADAIVAAEAVESPGAAPIVGVSVDGDTDAEGDGNMGDVTVSEFDADLQPTLMGTAGAPLTPPPEAPAPAPAPTAPEVPPASAGRSKASAPRTYEGTSDLAEIEADMKATIASNPMLAWAESLVEVFAQVVYFLMQLSKAWQLFRDGVELVLSSTRDSPSDDADRRRAGPSIGATQTYLESLPTEQNSKQQQEQQQLETKRGGDEGRGGNEGPGLWARLFRRGESAGAEAEAKAKAEAEAESEEERPRVEVESPPAGRPGRGAQLLDAAIPNRQRRMSERFMADVRTMLKNNPARIRQFQIETDNFRNGVLSAKVSGTACIRPPRICIVRYPPPPLLTHRRTLAPPPPPPRSTTSF